MSFDCTLDYCDAQLTSNLPAAVATLKGTHHSDEKRLAQKLGNTVNCL